LKLLQHLCLLPAQTLALGSSIAKDIEAGVSAGTPSPGSSGVQANALFLDGVQDEEEVSLEHADARLVGARRQVELAQSVAQGVGFDLIEQVVKHGTVAPLVPGSGSAPFEHGGLDFGFGVISLVGPKVHSCTG
jgi:hypothetical protein